MWTSSAGPLFTYVQGTATGGSYSPSFINQWVSYQHAFNDYIDDNVDSPSTAFPNPSDYLPNSGSNGELVTKGFVVRRRSSPTTFAIAPPTFKPHVGDVVFVPDEVEEFLLGQIIQSIYTIDVTAVWVYGGVADYGPVYDIEVVANGQPVTINGFVASYARLENNQGFEVTGQFTLTNNSVVNFSGIANSL